jgi:hypothetical protein
MKPVRHRANKPKSKNYKEQAALRAAITSCVQTCPGQFHCFVCGSPITLVHLLLVVVSEGLRCRRHFCSTACLRQHVGAG